MSRPGSPYQCIYCLAFRRGLEHGCCCCCQVTSVVSDSVRPHRRQPSRLPRPWDSPGKNTGVGCHFLLQCMKVKSESEVAQSCPTLRTHRQQPTRLLHGTISHWDSLSMGVSCHAFPQGIFPIQGPHLHLLVSCIGRQVLYL